MPWRRGVLFVFGRGLIFLKQINLTVGRVVEWLPAKTRAIRFWVAA